MKTPTPRLAAALACTLLFAFYPLSAQLDTDAAPKSPPITASFAADYRYSSYLPPEEAGDRWRSAQSASFEARARAGNLFSFSARVETDGKPGSFDPDAAIETLSLAFSPFPACTLTAGKQNLQWGTARAFSSITRLAPPVDPLEPEGSSRSVTGVRADLIPAWWLSLTGVALPGSVPGSPADETTGALRAELLVLTPTSLSGSSARLAPAEIGKRPSSATPPASLLFSACTAKASTLSTAPATHRLPEASGSTFLHGSTAPLSPRPNTSGFPKTPTANTACSWTFPAFRFRATCGQAFLRLPHPMLP